MSAYQVDERIIAHLQVTAPHLATLLTGERMELMRIILDLEGKKQALLDACDRGAALAEALSNPMASSPIQAKRTAGVLRAAIAKARGQAAP